MKKIISISVILILTISLTGCVRTVDKTGKLRDLDFTVVSEERLPAELKQIIDERKQAAFKVTFTDKEYLYICVGYGEQSTGGYSIVLDELYETQNSIVAETKLLGPKEKVEGEEIASYPYIVIKLENIEKPVVFE